MTFAFPSGWVFLHLPKTGGTWLSRVLPKAFMEHRLDLCPRTQHAWLADARAQGADGPAWAIVRDPVDWYRSIFRFVRKHEGRRCWPVIDGAPEYVWDFSQGSFEEFVKHRLAVGPGAYSALVRKFAEGCAYVARFENLREDVARGIALSGEIVPQGVYSALPVNSTADFEPTPLSPETEARLRDAERWVYDTFYPQA